MFLIICGICPANQFGCMSFSFGERGCKVVCIFLDCTSLVVLVAKKIHWNNPTAKCLLENDYLFSQDNLQTLVWISFVENQRTTFFLTTTDHHAELDMRYEWMLNSVCVVKKYLKVCWLFCVTIRFKVQDSGNSCKYSVVFCVELSL